MLLVLLLAPFVFNLSGLIDTYLTQLFWKHQETGQLYSSTGTLMVIGWVVALIFSLWIVFVRYEYVFDITIWSLLYLFFSGISFGLAAFPYFESLKIDKIENIFPILQTIPLFAYVLANIMLWETLSLESVILMFLIVFVTAMFSRNITTGKIHIRSLLLMLFSSLLYALSYVLFKIWWWEEQYIWVSYFWEHIGIAFCSLLFFLPTSIRNSTLLYFKNNGIWFSLLNIGNEILFIVGILITSYLTLYYPIAFVKTISNWLQPLLWFIMVYVAYKILPSIFEREYTKKELLWKISLCIISFVLIYLFYSIQ